MYNLNDTEILSDEVPSIESLLLRIDSYVLYADKVVGNEGLVSVIRKVVDGFIGILNNFKSVALHPLRMVKRSELLAFSNSNMLKVKKVNSLQYFDFRNIKLPIPRGMKSSYPDAAALIKESFRILDMVNRSKLATASIKKIYDTLHSNTSQFGASIKSAFATFDATTKGTIEKNLNRTFDKQTKTMEIPFTEMFKSVTEFTNTATYILDLSYCYSDIEVVYSEMNAIQHHLGNIVDFLEDNSTQVNKADVKSLGDLAYLYADVFSVYGTLVHQYHRIDHNYTECYKAIIKELKI